jgi:predicted pyridoxine 5'-phosphate oxidase superfamily flavin-nucleotide-binding protein
MAHRLTSDTIDDEAQLRALLGEPTPIVCSKTSDRVNRLTRAFIERASMVFLATSGSDGSCDVSPRGDPAGFVRVLDERTLLLPERPGNRLADSLRNIPLLEPSACEGKVPKLGLIVDVEQAFTHCSKAFPRSDFWNAARFADRAELPTNGQIHKELARGDFDAEEYDRARAERYARREGFY